jgi:hypothetical protein
MADQAWPEKGDGVETSSPNLPGMIVLADLQAIQGSGKHHVLVRHYKALLWADSYKVRWASFQQECFVEGYRNCPQSD